MAEKRETNSIDAVQALIDTIEDISKIKVKLEKDPDFDFKIVNPY